jgi:hypothetical protein
MACGEDVVEDWQSVGLDAFLRQGSGGVLEPHCCRDGRLTSRACCPYDLAVETMTLALGGRYSDAIPMAAVEGEPSL